MTLVRARPQTQTGDQVNTKQLVVFWYTVLGAGALVTIHALSEDDLLLLVVPIILLATTLIYTFRDDLQADRKRVAQATLVPITLVIIAVGGYQLYDRIPAPVSAEDLILSNPLLLSERKARGYSLSDGIQATLTSTSDWHIRRAIIRVQLIEEDGRVLGTVYDTVQVDLESAGTSKEVILQPVEYKSGYTASRLRLADWKFQWDYVEVNGTLF